MTTIDTAAATTRFRPIAALAATCWAALALAGCETSSSLLGGNNTPAPTALAAPPAATAPAAAASPRIAIAPVIGPPEAVSKQLVAQLSDSSERQKVAIAKTAAEPAAFTLRGYFVAPAKDKAGAKLSYIWDVTDGAGKRVNRITGEEMLAPAKGADPWSSVTPQIMQSIADKTATSLAAWLPSQSAAGTPVAGATPASPAIASAGLPPLSTASASASSTTTGSIPGAILAVAPRVAGAPGDGNTSLAAAMRRELEDKGVQIADAGQTVYRVSADVKIKPAKDGMQAIAINWTINDPKGAEVAKITQNNEVPAGYLDKAWGQSADDAARAASVQIKQVIADHRSGKQIQSSANPPADRKVN